MTADAETMLTGIRTQEERLADLRRRLEEAAAAGSPGAIRRQHEQGKLTARERIELLCDEGSFVETGALARHRCAGFGMAGQRPYGDGVVTGYGTVDGRRVCVYAQDFTVFGGSVGEVFGEKVGRIMDLALSTGCPIVAINDSGGARIQEGVVSLAKYIEVGRRQIAASGVVPQISLVMGPCAGGAAYSAVTADFVVMVDGTSHMFVTGPDVIRAVTGEEVSLEELGGGRAHATRSGNAHHLAAGDREAIEFVRCLLSYLPSNNMEDPPVYESEAGLEPTDADRELDRVLPDSPNQPYDMRAVVRHVLDGEELLEIQPLFAANIVCGLGRVEGRTVAVVANQPLHLAGVLDIDASEKAARFVRFCDAFGIPVLTFVDLPGYLPGTDQEWGGIIRRGAKLSYAYGEATVPKITVIVRKAYGGGYAVMGSKHLGSDVNLAWPSAEIAVLGAPAAVAVLYRRELKEAADPDALRRELIRRYEEELAGPYDAADRGYVDAVIAPSETRPMVVRALRATSGKRETLPRKKHGNIPL
jgi:propionyl-CoA carboxylase beta chain